MSEVVLDELDKKSDGASGWASARNSFVVPFDPVQQEHLAEIMSEFPLLAKEGSNRNRADPFVIALARSRQICVITEEDHGTENKPKIPYVCGQLHVDCIDILTLMRLESWKY